MSNGGQGTPVFILPMGMGLPGQIGESGETENDADRRTTYSTADLVTIGKAIQCIDRRELAEKSEENETKLRDSFGLCGRCTNFDYRVMERGKSARQVYAECRAWTGAAAGQVLQLSSLNLVLRCSFFKPRGFVQVHDMIKTALKIEPNAPQPLEGLGNQQKVLTASTSKVPVPCSFGNYR